MVKLNLPEFVFSLRKRDGLLEIFDEIRRKYIVLTPEEWVRQNFIKYLINKKNYPAQLMAVEKSITLNTMKVRPDIVIYTNKAYPLLIVECKAPSVIINQNSFDQIAKYNFSLKVKLLAVTNGMDHYYCKMDYSNKSYIFLRDLPDYKDQAEF